MANRKELLARISRGKLVAGDVFKRRGDRRHYVFLSMTDQVRADFAQIGGSGGTAVIDWNTVLSDLTLVDIGRRHIDGGWRPDSRRRHFLIEVEPGIFRYCAGCQSFASLGAALKHWAPGTGVHSGGAKATAWKRRKASELFERAAALGWVSRAAAGLPPLKKKVRR